MLASSFMGGRPRRLEVGFTLIEVIVALVILATSGLVLFAWINQNLQTATRLRESQARSQLQLEGISWLSTVNPAAEPEGSRDIGELRLTWQSVLVEPIRNQDSLGGALTPKWSIGLYQVTASVTRIDTGLKAEWRQHLAGWVRPGASPATGAASPLFQSGRTP